MAIQKSHHKKAEEEEESSTEDEEMGDRHPSEKKKWKIQRETCCLWVLTQYLT